MQSPWVPRTVSVALIVCLNATAVVAETFRVPADHKSIQSAIDAAASGDTVLVNAGVYCERIRLKPGLVLRSEGDDVKGKLGLKRAETTIIDGEFQGATGAGVTMAEDSVLDGFTVTGVGQYDEAAWKRHHATFGEQQPHEDIGGPGTPGISVVAISRCTIRHNIVHHIGYTGIAITGAKEKRVAPLVSRNVSYRNMGGGIGSMNKSSATIEANLCFENFYAGIGHNDASPLVVGNTCHSNIRAGIGVSEGASPVVRDNVCYSNRRAGIGIRSGETTQPIVEDNRCYENEMAGIGSRDAARPIIRRNCCFKNRMAGIGSRDGSRAVIEENECYENEMAGIGSRLGASPIIRGNRCYRNLMAGIGAREGARPVIENNECFENRMAGVGTQQDAVVVIRDNLCHHNEMAGIGSRLGARPVIVDNVCHDNRMSGIGTREGAAAVVRANRSFKNQMAGFGNRRGARSVLVENESRENRMAGIGVRDKPTTAVIIGNRCVGNRLVAIGLPDGASGFIHGNELSRIGGGAPPLVAVKGGARGVVSDNRLSGGGVAGVLVQGNVKVIGNRFRGKGPGQGSAIWVWKESQLMATDNQVDGYRNAIHASGSRVTAVANITRGFQGPSIVVRQSTGPSHVTGNIAISDNSNDTVVSVDGSTKSNAGNVVRRSKGGDQTPKDVRSVWLSPPAVANGDAFHPLARTGKRVEVRQGRWKLLVTYGQVTTYRLFHIDHDPEATKDLSGKMDQICFRLRGVVERQQALEFQAEMRGASGPPRQK